MRWLAHPQAPPRCTPALPRSLHPLPLQVVIDKLSFICAFITDYAFIIKSISARRAEKEAQQATAAAIMAATAGTAGGDGGADLSKSRAPKSVAPASVGPAAAPASIAAGQGSAPQSQVMGSVHASGANKSASTFSTTE